MICAQNGLQTPQRVESTSSMYFRYGKKIEIDFLLSLVGDEGWVGFLVQKFLRYKLDRSCMYGCIEY